ncbi:MAG: transglycosylase domain-containing protein [Candidatus Aminicenantes bacterium]|nr:transglycosylase domain-containing protein [Candidatus Aminicenantes bacterium]
MKISMLAVTGALLILALLFFSLRNLVLNSILNSKIESYLHRHPGAFFSIDTARFRKLDHIIIKNIYLRSGSQPIVMALGSCSLKISFWNMIIGRLRIKDFELDDLKLDLFQDGIPRANPARPAKQVPMRPMPAETVNYAVRGAALLDLFFARMPATFKISRLTIHCVLEHVHQTFHIPVLSIDGPAFATTVEIIEPEKKQAFYFTGNIQRMKKKLSVHVLPLRRGAMAVLPFIDRQWGLRVSFNSVSIGLESHGRHSGELSLSGSLAVGGLTINHPRIADEDVNLENAGLDYALNVGADYFELDDLSRIHFNKLSFHPYFKFKTRPTRQLTLKLGKTRFKADDFFSSLPTGLFSKLAGIKTKGDLAYELNFFIDFSHPEKLHLEANMEKHAFRIAHFGRVDFTAVNEPFLYTAYEKDRELRSFMVGPENPDFRSLEQMPSFLKNAILISEDGAFFGHRGFSLGPIMESIAANVREKRFVRGASTISMQLVKNLYLSRQKTVARKFEEMLITWLIEENRLLAKERIYEIYLNIIEWGPLVYGANEASHFYFDKDVEKLTLAEAIFMASIIPRPKRFMTLFDSEQRLRPWLQSYYRDLSAKMLSREMISQDDFDTLVADIQLNGPARFFLNGNENLAVDAFWRDEATEE